VYQGAIIRFETVSSKGVWLNLVQTNMALRTELCCKFCSMFSK